MNHQNAGSYCRSAWLKGGVFDNAAQAINSHYSQRPGDGCQSSSTVNRKSATVELLFGGTVIQGKAIRVDALFLLAGFFWTGPIPWKERI